MKIHKFVCFAIGLSLLLFASGCGYQIGSLMHPQIKTIAIAPVVNDTLAYNASAEMRNLLSEQFMRDGSLKVVSLSKADCQVFVRITQVAFSEITERSYDDEDEIFVPDEWQVTVNAEFSVIIPGRREPLIPRRVVNGRANFQAPGDMDASRRRGILQACREAARQVVEFTTTAW